jgi:hypothetical protein
MSNIKQKIRNQGASCFASVLPPLVFFSRQNLNSSSTGHCTLNYILICLLKINKGSGEKRDPSTVKMPSVLLVGATGMLGGQPPSSVGFQQYSLRHS